MGLLSSVGSVTRYRVEGTIDADLIDTVRQGLNDNLIQEIDNSPMEKSVGWTALEHPYHPEFKGSSFIIGTYFVFVLRMDKKSIPAKTVSKHYHMAMAKKLADEKRTSLSRSEKKMLKEHVLNLLALRIPATPNIYDILWAYAENELWLFSTQKAAGEALESLFSKSFNLTLVRLFPYTMAEFHTGLTDARRDLLNKLTPSSFAKRDGS